MAFYRDRVLPHIVDRSCSAKNLEPLRGRVCAGLAGEVVEVGFGSGLNLRHYPAEVTRVTAVEPADIAWRLAAPRVEASPFPVDRSGLDGQRLPFADGSFDGALSTFTLCTIPDAAAALQEIRRVLRPSGAFHFLEHGLAPDEPVRKWQRRIEPFNKKMFGGCHLTRPIADLVAAHGFKITKLKTFYGAGALKSSAAITLGAARPV